MSAGVVIAIDGPAGSGKSTVAGALAERLGCRRLDTGAMYRALTLLALRSGTDIGDGAALAALAEAMDYTGGDVTTLNGEDVSAAIRAPEVDLAVSTVAAHPGVRRELVRRQRAWVAVGGAGVVEGRDIGSVVLPDADLKVFLTAHLSERAKRRQDPGVARRDALDQSRAESPLVVPGGALVIDSTNMSVNEVVEEVLSHL